MLTGFISPFFLTSALCMDQVILNVTAVPWFFSGSCIETFWVGPCVDPTLWWCCVGVWHAGQATGRSLDLFWFMYRNILGWALCVWIEPFR